MAIPLKPKTENLPANKSNRLNALLCAGRFFIVGDGVWETDERYRQSALAIVENKGMRIATTSEQGEADCHAFGSQ